MKKTLLFSLVLVALIIFGGLFKVSAATPTLSVSSLDSDNVQVTVNGDANANVLIYYTNTSGVSSLKYLGVTNSSGYFSQSVSSASLNITPESVVYVSINSQLSSQTTWPINSTTASGGAISFSQTGIVTKVGQSSSITVNNAGSQSLYLLNNSNPQVANVNISGNTSIGIMANAYGQTVVTVCALNTTSNCASAYITVQNTTAQALTFSQSTLTIAYGQSATVSILNGSGAYSIINNSNPSIIQASLSNSTVTLTANNNSGTAALTVCSSDMSSCGIINATAGTSSSAGITFNQSSPTLNIGQSLSITVAGGTSYNISSNSNSNILSANISGSTLTLFGNSAGSSTVTVCSNSGNCASLTATVSYASTGGALTLSQNYLWLQAGQAVSVVVSGGSTPYSIDTTSSKSLFSASLNNNILTLTGITAGSSSVDVCSAGGACLTLSVLVNGTATNTQLTLSNNNLSLAPGASTSVSLFGSGGYYVSNSNNQNVATVTINGSSAKVNALIAGNANATICQTGGQCATLYVSVVSATNNVAPSFSKNNPELASGKTLSIILSGSDTNTYFISSNSNPTIVQANISGSTLTIKGLAVGSSVLSVCSATNNCSSLAVKVTALDTGSSDDNGSSSDNSASSGDQVLATIEVESGYVFKGRADVVAGNVKMERSNNEELDSYNKYVTPLIKGISISADVANAINYFIWYGTPGTKRLGAGERAGVISSYQEAYNKLPQTEAEWSDVLKIASGRWPSEASASAIAQAKSEFKKVYDRDANMSNNKDENAITVIAYGLRPTNRNTNSEKVAIKSFRYVYGHDPVNPLAWNIVRAIAYSGASK